MPGSSAVVPGPLKRANRWLRSFEVSVSGRPCRISGLGLLDGRARSIRRDWGRLLAVRGGDSSIVEMLPLAEDDEGAPPGAKELGIPKPVEYTGFCDTVRGWVPYRALLSSIMAFTWVIWLSNSFNFRRAALYFIAHDWLLSQNP